MKEYKRFLVVLLVFSFLILPVVWADELISYRLIGEPERTYAVAQYLEPRGYQVTQEIGKADGVYDGQRWPGVNIIREGAEEKEGIWVPVSDKALQNGLCSDQISLLDSLPRIQHTVLAIDEARAESCESVSFIVQPDQITMTIDLVGAGIEDLEGETVLAHSKYLNNRYGHKKDILAEAVVENGKLIFEFKNRQAPERIWFSVPRLNRWIVPCSRFLYPDSKGNDSIEVLFSSDNVKPVGGDWGKDRPERSGAPDRVYIEE